MFSKLLAASLLMLSTSAFATAVPFSGHDNAGTDPANTAKVTISYLDSSFDLSGVLDPSFRVLNPTNSGLSDGITLVSDSDNTFTYAPIITWTEVDLTRYTFSFSNLAAGTYTLQFNLGLFGGGGNYTGSYTITPVPEPETYGMMLMGLAMIGSIALRRKSA